MGLAVAAGGVFFGTIHRVRRNVQKLKIPSARTRDTETNTKQDEIVIFTFCNIRDTQNVVVAAASLTDDQRGSPLPLLIRGTPRPEHTGGVDFGRSRQ